MPFVALVIVPPETVSVPSFGQKMATSPWGAVGATRDASPDESGLSWSQEYDRGYWPTDPWHVDTDKDGVTDYYAYEYHLKGDDAGTDADGDGLSEIQEFSGIESVAEYAGKPGAEAIVVDDPESVTGASRPGLLAFEGTYAVGVKK